MNDDPVTKGMNERRWNEAMQAAVLRLGTLPNDQQAIDEAMRAMLLTSYDGSRVSPTLVQGKDGVYVPSYPTDLATRIAQLQGRIEPIVPNTVAGGASGYRIPASAVRASGLSLEPWENAVSQRFIARIDGQRGADYAIHPTTVAFHFEPLLRGITGRSTGERGSFADRLPPPDHPDAPRGRT